MKKDVSEMKLKELVAYYRRVSKLHDNLVDLQRDIAKRLNLKVDMEPQKFYAFLRKYRGLNNFMAYRDQKRDPLRHDEGYHFCCEIVDKWNIKDVNKLVGLMRKTMKLSKEEAIAKIIVDTAFEYKLLYEHFMDIENGFVKSKDKKGKPVDIPQSNVGYF